MSGSPVPDPITGYHAHVYYNDDSRPAAAELRAELESHFEVVMGRWRDEPDHRDYPLWLGAVLDLDMAFLERHARSSGT